MKLQLCLLGLALVLLVAPACWANPFTGPTSPFYLDVYGTGTVVVQGTSFAYLSSVNASMYAISGGIIQGALYYPNSQGQNYTLAGVPVGSPYTVAGTSNAQWYDGTTDGTYDYYVTANSGVTDGVYRTDANWQNAQLLFGLTTNNSGLAYDAADNTLWITGYQNGLLREYSMTGQLLLSVSDQFVGGDIPAALGWDPVDHTLWAYSYGVFQQYSTTDGSLLQSGSIAGLTNSSFGGEFAEGAGPGSVPEPGSMLLLMTGILGLGRVTRKRVS